MISLNNINFVIVLKFQ